MVARKIVRRSVLGPVRDYNLLVDEDFKKPNQPTNKQTPRKLENPFLY